MLRDSININRLCCNPVVLKRKLVKPVKIYIFGPNLLRIEIGLGHTQIEKKKKTHKKKPKIAKSDYKL